MYCHNCVARAVVYVKSHLHKHTQLCTYAREQDHILRNSQTSSLSFETICAHCCLLLKSQGNIASCEWPTEWTPVHKDYNNKWNNIKAIATTVLIRSPGLPPLDEWVLLQDLGSGNTLCLSCKVSSASIWWLETYIQHSICNRHKYLLVLQLTNQGLCGFA